MEVYSVYSWLHHIRRCDEILYIIYEGNTLQTPALLQIQFVTIVLVASRKIQINTDQRLI